LSTYSNLQETESSVKKSVNQEKPIHDHELVSSSQQTITQNLLCTESKTDCYQQTCDTTLSTKGKCLTNNKEKNDKKEETIQIPSGNETAKDSDQKIVKTSFPPTQKGIFFLLQYSHN
jgi:hypothetical protein